MPRPDPRAPGDGQADLFGAAPVRASNHGRHSQAVDRAMDAAAQSDLIKPEDEALVTLVRAAAWSLDAFEQQNKPYGSSKLLPAVTEALRELRLTPDSRATETDNSLKDLLNGLGATTTDAPSEVHDPARLHP
ncbi:hypothetical protein ACVMLG_22065, partial [Escherichia coli]|jgi:hypothetical protein|uniref:hypothetical protein n=1 Tax=Rhodococcus sp. NPDC006774 TaxID=3157186 RepID=UPI0033DB9F62